VSQKKATVLLIDRDPNTQEIVRAFFEHNGYAVVNACGFEDCLEMVRRVPPDVIIAEMYTPTGHPPRLLRALRSTAETAAVPIITMSAHALHEDRERALAAGADRYLAKPVEPREVLATVEALLVLVTDQQLRPLAVPPATEQEQ
jgi:two-component system, cell cycle response regulator DivK